MTITLTQPSLLQSTCSTVSDVSIHGGSDGEAFVLGIGGTPPYFGDAGSHTNLSAGTYYYYVDDANGCGSSSNACSVTINEPACNLHATASIIQEPAC